MRLLVWNTHLTPIYIAVLQVYIYIHTSTLSLSLSIFFFLALLRLLTAHYNIRQLEHNFVLPFFVPDVGFHRFFNLIGETFQASDERGYLKIRGGGGDQSARLLFLKKEESLCCCYCICMYALEWIEAIINQVSWIFFAVVVVCHTLSTSETHSPILLHYLQMFAIFCCCYCSFAILGHSQKEKAILFLFFHSITKKKCFLLLCRHFIGLYPQQSPNSYNTLRTAKKIWDDHRNIAKCFFYFILLPLFFFCGGMFCLDKNSK